MDLCKTIGTIDFYQVNRSKINIREIGGYVALLPNELLNEIMVYINRDQLLHLAETWLKFMKFADTINDHICGLKLDVYVYRIQAETTFCIYMGHIILSDDYQLARFRKIAIPLIPVDKIEFRGKNDIRNTDYCYGHKLMEAWINIINKGWHMEPAIEKYLTAILGINLE